MDWNGRKVLVTGAAGFIGSHLVEELVERGARVTAFVRYTSRGRVGPLAAHAGELDVVAGDLTELESVQRAVAGQDTVFHLAASIGVPYSFVHPREVVQANTIATLNLLTAAREAGSRRLLLTSTSEVYGTARSVPIGEEHPLQAQSPYAASKIAADKLAESFHHAFRLPVVTVRPFNTYGPRQSQRAVIPTIIAQALAGGPVRLGATAPTRDFLYVRDTVAGMLRAAEVEAAVGEVLNLATGVEIAIGDLARKILDLLGLELEIVSDAARLRPGTSEVERLCGDNAKAARLLDWEPRTALEEGLAATIDWMRTTEAGEAAARYHV